MDYMNDLLERMRRDAERLKREEAEANEVDSSAPKPIEVDATEFYAKSQAKKHTTEPYDLLEGKEPSPIFRRGESFYFAIRFKRPLDWNTDKIRLEFSFGPKKQLGKGTLVSLVVTKKTAFDREPSEWDVSLSREERNIITLQVQVPPLAGVGLWRLKIVTLLRISGSQEKPPSTSFDCKENIYILFNPWCKEDPVFMHNGTWRQEYVLNDVGKIFVGSHRQPSGRPWVFGQFASAVLPSCVLLLEKSGLDYRSRGNPVKVVRAISAMVNSNDDNGVLIGNWSGNYDDGTAPWSWTGSSAILEQFLLSGGKPVKYGQCWVFSGVCTTVCRALGIPCRSVTNYVSAHDTDDSLTVDKYFDTDGEVVEEVSNDSIWNFHVWNDCWMARPDLPSGYGGWQAIDATPQETSEGVYRAGPASLLAVRRGEISYLYDAPFIFAEVNADVVHWQEDDESEIGWKQLKTNTYHVGRLIVTKRIGFDDDFGIRDMEIISDEYKSKEGSAEERMSVLNAARRGGLTYIYGMPPPGKEDVKFSLQDIEKVMIGKPFRVVVNVENMSSERRTITAVLSSSSVYYTGITARKVKRARGSFVLQPKQKEELGIEVTSDDYYDKLVDYSMMKIYAMATVKETQQTWAEEDDFRVEKPTLLLEVEGNLKVYRRFNLRISFTNPLQRALQDCELTIEGPGLAEPRKVTLSDIRPGENVSHVETLAPRKSGPRKISAVFSSRQLIDVVGSKNVVVEE